jgi:hypothetical protein
MKPAYRATLVLMTFFGTYLLTWLVILLLPLGNLNGFESPVALVAAVAVARYTWIHADAASTSLAGAIGYGALLGGGIGFAAGFIGPMVFAPEANQGPLLGIFTTGPAGVLVGAVAGLVYGLLRLRPGFPVRPGVERFDHQVAGRKANAAQAIIFHDFIVHQCRRRALRIGDPAGNDPAEARPAQPTATPVGKPDALTQSGLQYGFPRFHGELFSAAGDGDGIGHVSERSPVHQFCHTAQPWPRSHSASAASRSSSHIPASSKPSSRSCASSTP